jgi:SH3-like domain-containing protein
MTKFLKFAGFATLLLGAAVSQAQSTKKTPYWASISQPEARMRTGPSKDFPVKWVYKRQYLPVKVIAVRETWRKVEDPDGDQGWMYVGLLSPNRTALVIGSGVATLRDTPDAAARISWRVEPGVVGRIDDCQKGWCRLDVVGRTGYIEADRLWGEEAL